MGYRNWGSTTLSASGNITQSTTEVWSGAQPGSYAALLTSKKIVIKFAAGNIFTGQYLATDGTDGVLGWGRPCTSRPKALKVYVRYEPGSVDVGGDKIAKEETDKGIIYVAVGDWADKHIVTRELGRLLFKPRMLPVYSVLKKVLIP